MDWYGLIWDVFWLWFSISSFNLLVPNMYHAWIFYGKQRKQRKQRHIFIYFLGSFRSWWLWQQVEEWDLVGSIGRAHLLTSSSHCSLTMNWFKKIGIHITWYAFFSPLHHVFTSYLPHGASVPPRFRQIRQRLAAYIIRSSQVLYAGWWMFRALPAQMVILLQNGIGVITLSQRDIFWREQNTDRAVR